MARTGQSLLVIDSAEALDTGDILKTVNRLGTGPWSFSTLVGNRAPKALGHWITLQPSARYSITRLAMERLGGAAPPGAIERLLQASRGVPLFAEVLDDQLSSGATLDDIEGLVTP